MDDYFPLPLLHWIATNIYHNTMDINGIYQAPRKSVHQTNVSKLNIYYNDKTHTCRAIELKSQKLKDAGGDFNLFHNTMLQKHGAYMGIYFIYIIYNKQHLNNIN